MTVKLEPRNDFEKKVFWYIRDLEREFWQTWPEQTKQYFLPTTTMPKYWEIRHKPEYHKNYKRLTAKAVLMTPAEYINHVQQGFKYEAGWANKWISEQNVQRLKKIVEQGGRMLALSLDYSRRFGQEGMHRAELMRRLGVKKVPVIVVWNVDEGLPAGVDI